jgi:ascorbate-specific PTS system EIIC-type component UlaA
MNEQRFSQSSKSETSEQEKLIRWIEQNYPDLAEQAANQKLRPKNRWGKWLKAALGLLIANPKDFHGKALVKPDLKKHSRQTASMVSVSTLFNFFTNFPLLFYAFKSIGSLGVAFLLALITNGLILRFTNDAATAVSANKAGSRLWSQVALLAMLLMNGLQSIVAGVGTELLLNQSGLSQLKAKSLIENQRNQIESLKALDNPEYKATKRRCESGAAKLDNMERDNSRWDSLYVQLYGQWHEHDRDWSQVPTDQLPICEKMKRLHEEGLREYQQAKAEWEAKLKIRSQMGNDVAFLKQEMPVLYQRHFTEDGKIASGVEAARLAIFNFTNKFQQQDWAGLGFPLFFLLLSLVTSGMAMALTVAHAYREDTQQSFHDEVAAARDAWLEKQRAALLAQNSQPLSSHSLPIQDFSQEDSN